jgi:hypothetical protein
MKLPHAFLAALLSTAAPAQAADVTLLNGGNDITVVGVIQRGDAVKLSHTVNNAIYHQLPNPVTGRHEIWIWLASPGGSIQEAARMIYALHTWKTDQGVTFHTAVNDGQTCASACVLVFGAGDKWVLGNAFIGVHRAAASKLDASGQITDQSDPNSADADQGTMDMLKILSEQGAPASIIKRLVDTPNGDVSVVPYPDLAEWGVRIRPAVQ